MSEQIKTKQLLHFRSRTLKVMHAGLMLAGSRPWWRRPFESVFKMKKKRAVENSKGSRRGTGGREVAEWKQKRNR